jgi:group I intron endonuclease
MARFDKSNDMPKAPGVYIIRNTTNQKCYVGSTVNLRSRKFDHFTSLQKGYHKNPRLQNSFNAHGAEAFEFCVVELIDDKTMLIEREQHYIDLLAPEYNISPTAGNTLGMIPDEETRQKMSLAHKLRWESISPETRQQYTERMRAPGPWNTGKKLSPEHRAKVGAAGKGRIQTPEKRAKLSALQKGRIKSPEERANLSTGHKGLPSGMKGKKHTEEAKAKVRAARTGKPLSPETRAKISAAGTGKKIHDNAFKTRLAERNRQRAGILHTKEHKAKIAEGNKRRWERARAAKEQERIAQEQALLARWENIEPSEPIDPGAYKPLTLWDTIDGFSS